MSKARAEKSIRFHLALSSEQYLAFYQGGVSDVVVRSVDNRTIRFPAAAVRNFVTHNGVSGLFEIQFDSNHKLKKVVKIS